MTQHKPLSVKEKFANEEYPIHVIGRHLEVTEPMKNYAVDKLKKMERFGVRVIEATIAMDIQRFVCTVDYILLVNNTKIKVSGHTNDMYASIDEAIHRLTNKLRRYHQRLSEHHAKGTKEIEAQVNVIQIPLVEDINDQIEEETLKKREADLKPHEVISREKTKLLTLTQQEAVMKMELSEDPFLVYRSEEDRKFKVIHRREDGNYGILEIES